MSFSSVKVYILRTIYVRISHTNHVLMSFHMMYSVDKTALQFTRYRTPSASTNAAFPSVQWTT